LTPKFKVSRAKQYVLSKQNVLGAKQKVWNDKLMLKKRFKT
jgi:hypothetical protein